MAGWIARLKRHRAPNIGVIGIVLPCNFIHDIELTHKINAERTPIGNRRRERVRRAARTAG